MRNDLQILFGFIVFACYRFLLSAQGGKLSQWIYCLRCKSGFTGEGLLICSEASHGNLLDLEKFSLIGIYCFV